jgi:hypothetical protein
VRKGVSVKTRLNLLIDADLKEWAMEYAKRHDTTVTRLITDHFRHLRNLEESEQHEDIVDQI